MTAGVIVITGASRGIGAATAVALASPSTRLVLGARSMDELRNVAAEVERRGGSAAPIRCDVTNEAEVQNLMDRAVSMTGQIDVLVNAAGQAVVRPFEQLTLAEWETVVHVGLTGAFLCCHAALPYLPAGGTIVTITSVAARQPFPGWSAYCAAKAGLLAFTGAIREELRPRGIRVTALLPAAVDTSLWESVPGSWNRAAMLQSADIARTITWILAQPAEMVVEELTVGHVAGRL
jgi:3-oxoacyl-[acyl-carrier protein] reductase